MSEFYILNHIWDIKMGLGAFSSMIEIPLKLTI